MNEIGSPFPDRFLNLSEAMPYMTSLGYNNTEQVRYAIRKNLYRVGIEATDTRMPDAARPTYRINPRLCQLRLLALPLKRATPHKRGRPSKSNAA